MVFQVMASQSPTPAEFILAVALFDPNGFPQEHFATAVGLNVASFNLTGWIQGIFQSLGLQSLLSTSLQLEGARFFVTYTKGRYTTVSIRRHNGYLAALFAPDVGLYPQDLIPWLHDFDPNAVRPAPQQRWTTPLRPES